MNEKNKKYWIERAEKTLIQNEKSALQYEQELKKAYDRATQQIKKEVDSFYQKYATNGQISLAEAKQQLKSNDLIDFKKAQQVYLDEVNSIPDPDKFNEPYKSYLKKLSGKAYITKMDELTNNINHNIQKLSTGFNTDLGEILQDGYEDSYYKTIFNAHSQAGIGASFTTPGGKQLQQAVKEKWLGENYSDKIWKHKQSLISQLEPLIQQNFVVGKNSRELGKVLADKMQTSLYNATRLIRTEMNYISNKATIDAYKESGVVQKYEYVSTLDSRTSDICIVMDGKIFDIKDAKAGVSLPPLHPHCRSTTIPYYEDDAISALITDRVGRNKDGKSYRIGEDTTYVEWAEKHAEGQYAQRVKDNIPKYKDMVATMLFPELTPPKPKLSFSGWEHNKLSDMVFKNNLPTEDYTPEEILTAIADELLEIYPNESPYAKYIINAAATKLGYIGLTELYSNPYILDMKLNGVTMLQAKNRVLVGAPVDDIFDYLEKNKATIGYNILKNLAFLPPDNLVSFDPAELLQTTQKIYDIVGYEKGSIIESSDYYLEVFLKTYKDWHSELLNGLTKTDLKQLADGKYTSVEELKVAKEKKKQAALAKKQAKQKALLTVNGADDKTASTDQIDFDAIDLPEFRYDADDIYRKYTAMHWKTFSEFDIECATEYTGGSGAFNRPLNGYVDGWSEYDREPNCSLNSEGAEDKIIGLYGALEKVSLPDTIKVRRGGSLPEILGDYTNMFPKEYSVESLIKNKAKYEGTIVQIQNFLSTGIAADSGFETDEVDYRIVLPKGTHATYVEPYSEFGGTYDYKGEAKRKSGDRVKSEAEIIVQAGTHYYIKKLETDSQGKLHIEMIALPEIKKPPKKLVNKV